MAEAITTLAPATVIFGDDAWLVADHAKKIKRHALQAGYTSITHHVDAQFDWSQLEINLRQHSLFSEKICITLKITTDTLPKPGQTLLTDYLNSPAQDRCLIITLGDLDKSTQQRKWFKHISQYHVIHAKGLRDRALAQWLTTRANRYPLTLTSTAAILLADMTVGNMGEGAQALEKLYLSLGQHAKIDDTIIREQVQDTARFTLFQLSDACLNGDTVHIQKLCEYLQASQAAPLVLWVLTKEIRLLHTLCFHLKTDTFANAAKSLRIPHWRAPLLQKALNRHTEKMFSQSLQRCHEIDLMIKGMNRDCDPWMAMQHLALLLSGTSQ